MPRAQDLRARYRQCRDGLPAEDTAWLRREIGGSFLEQAHLVAPADRASIETSSASAEATE
eukprot:7872105-Pyramimonas_sp.AAC.1